MLHRLKLFFRYGPGVFEERHRRLLRLLLLIPFVDLVHKLVELYEARSEFPHRADLWLSAADCFHVTVELLLFVGFVFHLVLRRIGHPLPLSRFVRITSLPDHARPDPDWRYSRIDPASVREDTLGRGDNGLEAYAGISESFATIAGANPGLTPRARRRLYLDWYRLNPAAFMSLEHRNWYGGWSIVAISIILPLTQAGLDGFVEGQIGIRSLRRIDVEPKGVVPSALLIDTLVISKRYHRWTESFAFPGLPIRHVAEFWRDLPTAWAVLVEPDDPKVESKLLRDVLGFERCAAREEGGPLYVLRSDAVADPRIAADLARLRTNVVEVRAWPLHLAGDGALARPC